MSMESQGESNGCAENVAADALGDNSKAQSTEESEDEMVVKEMVVCGHKYFLDNTLITTSTFEMYKVHDTLRREFSLKVVHQNSISEYVNCLVLLKNKPCIASVIEYEAHKDSVSVIFELGQPIDLLSIPKNLLKRRVRQVLTAIASVSSAQLHFSGLNLSDFIETNGGLRLIHFESTIMDSGLPEKTFSSASHILNELIECRRITLDPTLYKELQKCILKASETDVSQIKSLFNSEIFRDGFKVTINHSNRALTPDPHNLVPMKKNPRPKQVEEVIPEPIRRIKPDVIISPVYVGFLGVGVIMSLIFVVFLQFSIKSSVTFTGLALKTAWIGIAACGALLLATFHNLSDSDADESTSRLRRWCIILAGYVLAVIGGKVLELGPETADAIGGISLFVWLIAALSI